MWIYFWAFYPVSQIYFSVFVRVPYFLITVALQYGLQSGILIAAALFFLRLIWLFGVFIFPYKLKNFFSSSVKNAICNLIEIALNVQVALGSIIIQTTLILPIHKQSICFHLFVLSLIYFINVLQLSAYRSFFSLGKFIPKYFILFIVMVNGIISLICISDVSLLLYRKARDFCVLVLYHVTLQLH